MNENIFHDYVKQLQKAIECSICLDELLDPVETRCGHTFCGGCLQTALSQKSVVPCPLCKFAIKKRGIKKATYLSNVVGSVKSLKKAFITNLRLPGFSESHDSSFDSVKETTYSTTTKSNMAKSQNIHNLAEKNENQFPVRSATLNNTNIFDQIQDDDDSFSFPESPINLNKDKTKDKHLPVFATKKRCIYKNAPKKFVKELNISKSTKPKNSRKRKGKKKENQNVSADVLPVENILDESSSVKDLSSDAMDKGVQEKVSNWLENVRSSPQTEMSDETADKCENGESDMDDFVSASQQQSSPFASISMQRSVVNQSILKAIKSKNEKLDEEVFGAKSKLQYKPKQSNTDLQHFKPQTSKVEETPKTPSPKKQKPARKKQNKKQKKKNIFDINGLSQGVSPFSSPVKEEKTESSQQSENQTINTGSIETHLDSPCQLNATLNKSFDLPDPPSLTKPTSPSKSVAVSDSNSIAENEVIQEKEDKGVTDFTEAGASQKDKNPKRLTHSENTNDSKHSTSQESQSTTSTVDQDKPNITTVAAVVHQQPRRSPRKHATKQEPTFKTPTITKATTSKMASSSTRNSSFLRLEDMPIVCVGETQDDGDKVQPYFVETPARPISSVLQEDSLKTPNDSIEKKSTELGLLQFSPPSPQEPKNILIDWPRAGSQSFSTAEEESVNKDIDGSSSVDKVDQVQSQPRSDKKGIKTPSPTKKLSKNNQIIPVSPEINKSQTHSTKKMSSKKDDFIENNTSTFNSVESSPNNNLSSLNSNIIQNTALYGDTGRSLRSKSKRRKTSDKSVDQKQVNSFQADVIISESELLKKSSRINGLDEKEFEAEVLISSASHNSFNTNLDVDSQSCKNGVKTNSNQQFSKNTPPFNTNKARVSKSHSKHQKSVSKCDEQQSPNSITIQPELNFATECNINRIHVDGNLKEAPAVVDCELDESISSSPLLFAPSQSEPDNMCEIKDLEKREISGTCLKCENRSLVDKTVQCPEFDDNVATISTLWEVLELTNKLKNYCKTLDRPLPVLTKIIEVENIFRQQSCSDELQTCSNESSIKPSSRRKRRVLPTSDDDEDLNCSSSQVTKHHNIQDQSDPDEFEIENSLPEITPKTRSSSSRVQNQIATKLSEKLSSNSKPNSNHKQSGSTRRSSKSSLTNFSPQTRSQSKKIGSLPVSVNSTGSDVIQATSKSRCRKRILSSSDEDESYERKSSKKSCDRKLLSSNESLSKFNNDFSTFEEDASQELLIEEDEQKEKQFHDSMKLNKISSRSDVAIEETPPLTESQVPSPSPPPQHVTDTLADTSGIEDLLKSVAKLTENSKERIDSNECIEVVSSDDSSDEKENMKSVSQQVSPSNDVSANQLDSNNKQGSAGTDRLKSPNPIAISDLSLSDSSYSAGTKKFGVMVSGLRGKAIGLVRLFAKKWGGEFYENFVAGKVTHAVVRTQNMRCDRTLKFLQAVASKAWVLSISWVTHSLKEKTLLPEDRYEVIGDNQETSEELLFSPKRSRLSTGDFKILSGFAIYCIPPFALFTEAQFLELLRLCGAHVCSKVESLSRCSSNLRRVITVDPDAYSNTLPNYAELAEKYKAETVACSWVLDCIGTFNMQPLVNFPVEDFDSEMLSGD